VAASDVTRSRGGAGNDAINAVIITFPLRTAPRSAADILHRVWADPETDEWRSYGTRAVDFSDEY